MLPHEATPPPPTRADLDALRDGDVEIVGRLLGSTNNALLCRVTLRCPEPEPPVVLRAVYKPIRGERPLDDFPTGTLSFREVAAYLVSEATPWAIVPPTVLREGPLGPGMVQRWIDVDPDVDVVALVVENDARLRAIAVFDAVVNNTDRKGGHLLPVPGGHIYGVDHGVCFSHVPKLRTVLWGWRGRQFDEGELGVLRGLREAIDGRLGDALGDLLAAHEVDATRRRLDALLTSRRFPQPNPDWPAIPWPPF